jgi:hypothetical protein
MVTTEPGVAATVAPTVKVPEDALRGAVRQALAMNGKPTHPEHFEKSDPSTPQEVVAHATT